MALSAALLMLAACGGGSGSDDSSAAVAPTIPVSPAAPGPTPDDEISDREGDLRQTASVELAMDWNTATTSDEVSSSGFVASARSGILVGSFAGWSEVVNG